MAPKEAKRLKSDVNLVPISLQDLPVEIIEEIIGYLSFIDLDKLSKLENRLKECVKRVSKKKPFSKCTHSLFVLLCYNFKYPKFYFNR